MYGLILVIQLHILMVPIGLNFPRAYNTIALFSECRMERVKLIITNAIILHVYSQNTVHQDVHV